MDFLIPPPRYSAGLQSSTGYIYPPLDGSLTVPELYDFHLENNPDHPVFVFANGSGSLTRLHYSQVVPAAHEAARCVARLTNVNLDFELSPHPVVAILAASDTITYFTTILGMLRAGIPIFPISPRNSVVAIAHLLSKTRPSHILVGPEANLQLLAQKATELLADDEVPFICPMPTFDDIYLLDQNFILSLPDVGMTCHQSHRFGTHNFHGEVFGCHAVAMFHGIGLKFIAWVASTGLTMATFAPASPAISPTPAAVFSGLLATSASYAFGPPAFFEEWYLDPSKIPVFRQLKGIVFGGAPLRTALGTNLQAKATPTTELTVVNTKLNGHDAYATNDILVPHPSKPGRWKILGRKDDQIMLSTGEKTNPGPLGSVVSAPISRVPVMFGRGKFQNGVLIQPSKTHSFDPSNTDLLSQFIDSIWDRVEEMNAIAPTHSRLFREMILVAKPSKPFAYTSKGAPKRPAILQDYNDEIENLYNMVNDSAQLIPPKEWSAESSLAFVRAAVNGILNQVAGDNDDIFERGCDRWSSLQAMWIRNTIIHGLWTMAENTRAKVSTTFVYEHPTIKSLTSYTFSLARYGTNLCSSMMDIPSIRSFLAPYTIGFAHHKPGTIVDVESPKKGLLRQFISSLSGFSKSPPMTSRPFDIILVTGTTGALGSAVLAKLVADKSVVKVYALNRPSKSGRDILRRHEDALRMRGYDPRIASSPKVVFVEGDLTRTGLGVGHVILEEACTLAILMRRTITHIVHIDIESIDEVPEVPMEDPNVAIGQGYSESKWVAECILYEAARQTALRPIVVRIGQISGGVNGAWNTTDWLPAIIKSSSKLGFLPDFSGTCSWIPLDLAAESLLECRDSCAPDSTIHLLHPQRVQGHDIFQIFSDELKLPLRPYAEWVKVLEGYGSGGDSTCSDHSRSSKIANDIPRQKLWNFLNQA
ncbi:hypothetical protein BD779DRAFT_1469959 [Infundibulicybe gibba]|nr:hypothetical protein BD779DRAFT_1469959 [Infundibulicybe gibba]